jgi:hypothetical protein
MPIFPFGYFLRTRKENKIIESLTLLKSLIFTLSSKAIDFLTQSMSYFFLDTLFVKIHSCYYFALKIIDSFTQLTIIFYWPIWGGGGQSDI